MTTQIDTAGCASDEALARLWAHDLDANEERLLRAHLDSCAACSERAKRLARSNDTWVERLRSVGAPPSGFVATPAALTSDSVPGYEIEGEVARGGQGVVYRAIQLATRRTVALKVLRDGALASDAARRRFQREIELVAELRHPNLLTIHDAGVTQDGRAYFAMEYVGGQSFGRWIEGRGPSLWRPAEAPEQLAPILRVFVKICGAVGYAHQRGVIHRDLKPSNILVDSCGEPRVVDFGLARWIATDRGPDVTALEQVAGTLPYMSPEQARGLPDSVDVRSDVYSLGVMLYEAITHSHPYPIEGDTVATLRHIAETEPTPPRRRPGGRFVDDELETIVLKSLSKDRERRYQSAGELGRDLENYLAGEPIEAKRDSTAYVLRKVLHRHRVLAACSAVFVVVVIGLAIGLAVLYARQSRLRSLAETRYEQVRDLARSFIFEFDPKIRRLPGAAAGRELVVRKGLEYLAILAGDTPDDPAIRREIASGYMAIGEIQADTTSSNLGRAQEAIASYREAIRMLEALGAANPEEDAELSQQLVTARLRLVDLLLGQRETESALRICKTAYELTEELLRTDSNDAYVDTHLDAMERLGNCMSACGDRASGEAMHAQVLEIVGELASKDPGNRERQRDLAVALTKVARSRYEAGDRDGTLDSYRRYVRIADQLLAESPNDVVTLRDSGVGYQWIGILELESGRPSDALAPLQKSLELLERLWSADSTNTAAGVSLAATLTRLIEAQVALQELDAAEQSAIRNMEVSRALVERSPDFPGASRQYGVSLYKLFELHQSRARLAGAGESERRQHQAEACAWLEKCHAWFVGLERQDKLDAADASVPDELEKELAGCRAAIDARPTTGEGS